MSRKRRGRHGFTYRGNFRVGSLKPGEPARRIVLTHRFALCLIHGGLDLVELLADYDRRFFDDGSRREAAHDPIKCGNRLCCNPAHLRWATDDENREDRYGPGDTTIELAL